MEQPFSTSKVTVEYFDPHDVFKLLAPGLVPRLPLRNLHWQSHAGPLRSIETLHVELVPSDDRNSFASLVPPSLSSSSTSLPQQHQQHSRVENDGFQTQIGVAATQSSEAIDQPSIRGNVPTRRHQIPGLRRTPYLKVLLVRCDDNDSYKGHVRQEIRDWIKANTPPSTTSKKANAAENHDAFEWLIVHVVIPNTVAATQPRKSDVGSGSDKSSAASRWRPGSNTLLEKLRSDFNSSNKSAVDHISQIRIGVNDVPYDSLPRVVPAVPSGYSETEQETENAWSDLIAKFRSLILSSFDMRVTQYEEDIKEKDAQRTLPGWNFCTFFILKEGLARGFESVGLVEDALVGYDELSVGLDTIIKDQSLGRSGSAANTLPAYTEELKDLALKARAAMLEISYDDEDELVDLQASQLAGAQPKDSYDDIPISSNKKPYRDLIVANNVSLFDFRCYIFARQLALLLRLGNAWSTREELLAKLKEQQDSVLYGVAPRAPPPKHKENEQEVLPMLAEICQRTLEFIPSVSQVMRKDLLNALSDPLKTKETDADPSAPIDPNTIEIVDNLVVSFAFSTAQQILAQTSTKALPIPSSSLGLADGLDSKASIPELKTIMHPARKSSLNVRPRGFSGPGLPQPPPSPNVFSTERAQNEGAAIFLKDGLEDLAAKRAELYSMSRNILEEYAKKRGWSNGWAYAPIVGESAIVNMVDIDLLNDDDGSAKQASEPTVPIVSMSGIDNKLLRTALDNSDDFYRLHEILTDKALRHYTVANHVHSIRGTMADLAVLKYHLKDYGTAALYFYRATPFFGESGWSLLELSMLIMYSKCLKHLENKEEYVTALRTLLSKAAAAESDRRQAKPSFITSMADYPDSEEIKGFMTSLILETKSALNETRIPLSNFFASIEIDGAVKYDEGRDGLNLQLKLDSLLADDLTIDTASVRIVNTSSKPIKEIWLKQEGPITIPPGRSTLCLRSNTLIPGSYEIDKIDLKVEKLCLYFEPGAAYASGRASTLLKSSEVFIYQPADALDIRVSPSKSIQLDRNNSVDLELRTGWNNLKKAEIRVKAATGGLRLHSSEAKCLGSLGFSRPPEGGMFYVESIPSETTLRIRFPYTLEQDTPNISLRLEVSYETEQGSHSFCTTPTVHTGLALGVNVQDVFKHNALFSRFTVSTASASPLRLNNSELLGSEMFESTFGFSSEDPVMIFPRQPASLLYKIKRKPGVKSGLKTPKTMYLKLHYSVLSDEVEALVETSLIKALHDTTLRPLSRLLTSSLLPLVRNNFTALELERAALRGNVGTDFLTQIDYSKIFHDIGKDEAGVDLAESMVLFLRKWQGENPTLALQSHQPDEPSSILIPVDIPSVTVVHTADIRLLPSPTASDSSDPNPATPTICTHQVLSATVHLKWTRMWDTATPLSDQTDLEFSYELSAPTDTWLLGGRRRGHFVIPAPASEDEIERSSSADKEIEIQILMIPLREGWLPYPTVDIREVRPDPGAAERPGNAPAAAPAAAKLRGPGEIQCETDLKNLGETVRVVADRTRVTLSLETSGPGGNPLVIGAEHREMEGRVLVI